MSATVTPVPASLAAPGSVDLNLTGFVKNTRVTVYVDGNVLVSGPKVGVNGDLLHLGCIVGTGASVGNHPIVVKAYGKSTILAQGSFAVVPSIPVPPPPAPGPVISNVQPSAITNTSVTIGWDVAAPGATGQVKFGTTTAYGQLSTLEPTLLTRHIQTLTGLAADTAYHFAVVGTANGKTTTSPDQTFLTTGAVVTPPPPPIDPPPPPPVDPPPPTNSVYPPDSTLKSSSLNSDPRPGYLQVIQDSTFKTNVRRISDVDQRKNAYSTVQAWSKDGKYISLMWGNDQRLIDASTYADLGPVPSGSGNHAWSNVYPHRMWGVSGHDGQFKYWEPGMAAWAVWDTLPFGDLYIGNYEGGISDDDHRIILNSGSTVIIYDPLAKKVIATKSIPNCDAGRISRSGKYLITESNAGTGTDIGHGTWLYDANDFSTVRQLVSKWQGTPHTGEPFGHLDMGWATDGTEVIVYVEPGGSFTNMQRLSDGKEINLVGGIFGVGHVSCTNYERPGWCLLSSNNGTYTSTPGFDQAVAVRLDFGGSPGNAVTENFGRLHNGNPSTSTVYERAPHASFNRKGDIALANSVWSPSASSPSFAYLWGMKV